MYSYALLKPCDRYLYWTSGRGEGYIERVNYTGGERTVILHELFYPKNIVLDASSGLMYWLDASINIQGATLNGSAVWDISRLGGFEHFSLMGRLFSY